MSLAFEGKEVGPEGFLLLAFWGKFFHILIQFRVIDNALKSKNEERGGSEVKIIHVLSYPRITLTMQCGVSPEPPICH